MASQAQAEEVVAQTPWAAVMLRNLIMASLTWYFTGPLTVSLLRMPWATGPDQEYSD